MQGLLETALSNPWATLEHVLDGPLHPGGTESTAALLDRAGVTGRTRVLDVGCGAGESLALARERGAEAVGLDLDPPAGSVRADVAHLPVRDASVDVVLAECVMCLVPDRSRGFDEVRRVLVPDGRFALSDVVVEGEPPTLPTPLERALCLSNAPTRTELVDAVEARGFVVEDVHDHRADLLAMRDEVQSRVDYESLLRLMGERGDRLLDAIEEVEEGVESGRIGCVSLVATADD